MNVYSPSFARRPGRPRLLLLPLLLSGALAAGCGGSGGGSRSAATTAAPIGSAAALPDPGGQIAALSSPSAAQVVTASLSLGVSTRFSERVSLASLQVPDLPGLREQAFALEDGGTLRVLDLNGPTPALVRGVALFGARLPAGTAAGALRVQSASLALATVSGQGAESVAVFDPLTAQGAADVTRYDLSTQTVTWPAGTRNDQGADVGGQPRPLRFTADAVVAGGKLIFASSNFDPATYGYDPGTLRAFDFDPATRALSGGGLLPTSDWNPTGITRLDTPQGELLLVTNTGSFGQPGGSIDLVDPVALRRVGSIPFPASAGATNPSGRVVVAPDGRRGYVGSGSQAAVYVLDLDGVGAALGAATAQDHSARFRGGYALPAAGAYHFVSGLGLSHDGERLYAVDMNESALFVVDLRGPALAARVAGFARSGVPANFEGLANLLAVRPGVPGVDFQGPELLVGTINLAAADRALTDVSVVLDAVALSR